MVEARHRIETRSARLRAILVVAFAVSAAAFASPASAAESKVHLSGAIVTPRSGGRTTTFVFSVVYRHDAGSPAESVKVTIGGSTHGMRRQSGGDWTTGTTYRWSGRLSVGVQSVSFGARSKDHDHDEAVVAAGTVTVGKDASPTPISPPTPTAPQTPTHDAHTDTGADRQGDAGAHAKTYAGTDPPTDTDRATHTDPTGFDNAPHDGPRHAGTGGTQQRSADRGSVPGRRRRAGGRASRYRARSAAFHRADRR